MYNKKTILLQFCLYFYYIVSLCWMRAVTLQRQNIGGSTLWERHIPMVETQLFI